MTHYSTDEQIGQVAEIPEGVTLEDLLIPLRAALGTCHNTNWTLRQFKTHIAHVLSALDRAALQGEPIGEIVRSFSNGSGLDVRLFGKLTSDTPGIVGTKLYTALAPAVPRDEREAFEAWWRSHRSSRHGFQMITSGAFAGQYRDGHVNDGWIVWKASRAALTPPALIAEGWVIDCTLSAKGGWNVYCHTEVEVPEDAKVMFLRRKK